MSYSSDYLALHERRRGPAKCRSGLGGTSCYLERMQAYDPDSHTPREIRKFFAPAQKSTAQDIAVWRAARRKARLEAVHRVRSFAATPHGEWRTATAEDILADLRAGIDAIRNQPRPSQREIDERIAANAKLRQLYDEASPEEKIRMQETVIEMAALRIMHEGGP